MPSKHAGLFVKVPAILEKAAMGSTAQWIDYVNGTDVEYEGIQYATGTLRFLGFFGVFHGADRLFYGHYRLVPVPAQEQDVEACDLLDFYSLPGLVGAQTPEPPAIQDEAVDGEESE